MAAPLHYVAQHELRRETVCAHSSPLEFKSGSLQYVRVQTAGMMPVAAR